MSCPPKSEPARERDPRKTPNVASRGDIVGADNQIDTAVEEANIEVFNLKACAKQPTKSRDSSFLCCVICRVTPRAPPLHGCCNGHHVCTTCLLKAGESPECPECGEKDLSCRLSVAESLLPAELEGGPRPCPFKDSGCTALVTAGARARHATTCLFRPVRCPKAIFSSSCLYKGPYCTIQSHGRSQHSCEKGVINLEPGLITTKMFDKGLTESACDEPENARFVPVEMLCGDDVFYCYYERVAERRMWFFFIRHFGAKEAGQEWVATISLGKGGLARSAKERASHFYKGPAAPYSLGRREIYNKGLMLTIPDEVMRANKVKNILFRVWWKVEVVKKEKSTLRKRLRSELEPGQGKRKVRKVDVMNNVKKQGGDREVA